MFRGRESQPGNAKGASLVPVLLCLGSAFAAEPQRHEFEGDVSSPSRASDLRAEYERDRLAVREVYARHAHRLLWVADRKLTSQGTRLLQTLRDAEHYGLRSEDYDAFELWRQSTRLGANRAAQLAQWAELDAGITIATTRFVRHLHSGRVDPRLAGFYATSPRIAVDVPGLVRALSAAAAIEPVLGAVEPPHAHYRLLKHALRHYRLLASEAEPAALPDFARRSVKMGDSYPGMPDVRRLLKALGDRSSDPAMVSDVLDETDAAAIRRFQRRHGLEEDGAIGRRTLAALRTPLAARVRQIEMTLERWRWLPDFDSPPILVNVPQFRLFAFRTLDERPADARQMDVIVGKEHPTSQTPIFAAELQYVVFRPYWEVPQSIVDDEMLPAMRRNVGFVARNDLEIMTPGPRPLRLYPTAKILDRLAAGQVRLRQLPGPNNSLGLVKLMMPNPFNVYLHGTPAEQLFDEPRRAFSHGCIRLSDPAGLVEHVLQGQLDEKDERWTREKIQAAMQDARRDAENRHVHLRKPVPVVFFYGTAMAEENGDVLFFEDLYGHDERLAQLLAVR